MNLPEYSLDMVRAGIILYGVYPFPEANKDFLPLESCLSLRAQISHVKDLEAGERIGYGLTYTAQSRIKVATLPVGYADGWSRELSNKGSVLIGGKRAPIIGRVCMDQLMVDVTGIDAERGEEAVLMGRQGNEEITIEEIAGLIGQIPAAVMCMLSRRLPRVYTKENRPPEVVDYLID
jgi:alanine racemase